MGSGQNLGFKAELGASRYNFRQVNFPTYVSQYETFKHQPIWSASVGMYSKFEIGKSISLSASVNYTKKGNREYTIFNSVNQQTPDTSYQNTSDTKTHMHYIDLTGLIHLKKLNLFFGGQVSYLSRIDYVSYHNVTGSYDGNEIYSNTQQAWRKHEFKFDYYNRVEFATALGYEHEVSENAKLTLTYFQGITGVLNQDFFINYRNSQLMLGLTYALKTKEDKSR